MSHIHKGCLLEQLEEGNQGETAKPVAPRNYYYYYYIRLMAFFQDNLGKPAPER